MPELPEVEIVARNLYRWMVGRRIESVEIDARARRVFRPATPRSVAAGLTGARLRQIHRIGKQILLTFDCAAGPLGLLSHLGMTGKWVRRSGAHPPPRHSRVRLLLDDWATLHYTDPRLFGRLRLVPGARFGELPEIRALGPDPLGQGIDSTRLAAALARTRRPVKVALLDQRLLAGVGNIYASESLFRARIDPRRPAVSLSRVEIKRLARSILESFRYAIALEEGPEVIYLEESGAANRFLVYDHGGERCPRCRGEKICRVVQAQRSTYYCPRCQR